MTLLLTLDGGGQPCVPQGGQVFLQSGQGLDLASAFQLPIPWGCVQHKCGVDGLAGVEEEGVWVNWNHSME